MKKIYEDIRKVFESKASFRILCSIGIVVVALLIFSGGVAVGFHKASFGAAWEQHYMDNFGMMPGRRGFSVGMGHLPIAHGATGKIIKTELPNIIIEDKDGTEKIISITDDTPIERGLENIKGGDLKVNDFMITIGTPNDKGIVDAKFIRVIPSPQLLNQ